MSTNSSTSTQLSYRLSGSVAVFDVSQEGRLRVSGDDAVDLLNRLSTNELETLEPGEGAGTVLTTNKGRIIDLLRVLHCGDHLLMLTSAGTQQRVADWIDFYTFAEDVSVEDVTAETQQTLIVGDHSAGTIERAGMSCAGLDEPLSHMASEGPDGQVRVVRIAFGELTGYEIIAPTGSLFSADGPEPLSGPELAQLKVEQGVPAYPAELNEDRNPLEANLQPHINFNKGCYIGQEVVARLNTYDRVQRYLCQLELDDGSVVESGSPVIVGSDEVGEVTTATEGLALAYLRKRAYQDRAEVVVRSGDRLVRATVRDIRPPVYFE